MLSLWVYFFLPASGRGCLCVGSGAFFPFLQVVFFYTCHGTIVEWRRKFGNFEVGNTVTTNFMKSPQQKIAELE